MELAKPLIVTVILLKIWKAEVRGGATTTTERPSFQPARKTRWVPRVGRKNKKQREKKLVKCYATIHVTRALNGSTMEWNGNFILAHRIPYTL